MTVSAPTLLELQRAVRGDLLGLAECDASEYVVPDGLAPSARLAIYRNTANSTLTTALRLAYPAVHALVGPEFFEGAARLFIEQCPPADAQLDNYGETFPDFLSQIPQAASLAYVPDTARLEWCVNAVLHAPDAKPLDLGRLQHVQQTKSMSAQFLPGPAVRLLRSDYPVDAIWCAVLARDDKAMADINLAAGPVWLYVCRGTSGVDVRRVSEWQWTLTAALLAGCPLYEAIAKVPDSDVHVWLAFLLASGCFTDVSVLDDVGKPSEGPVL
jgi:hypothetical protein